jgi:ABC-type oligopeptide transport system ATPase subunit
MLDASIRLDVLNLLSDLRETEGVSVLYITHDIASARYICDRINVMYGGRIVEAGPTKQIISDTIHPYTRLLLSAAPDPARYKGSANKNVQTDGGVEHRCWFVGQQNLRADRQSSGDGDALTLTTRKVSGVAVEVARRRCHVDLC